MAVATRDDQLGLIETKLLADVGVEAVFACGKIAELHVIDRDKQKCPRAGLVVDEGEGRREEWPVRAYRSFVRRRAPGASCVDTNRGRDVPARDAHSTAERRGPD
jgi:hypothetical protein